MALYITSKSVSIGHQATTLITTLRGRSIPHPALLLNLFLGANASGKSTVFAVLQKIQAFVSGDSPELINYLLASPLVIEKTIAYSASPNYC
jgi:energy-coupling factor transporter ATP-binding protein EcfA2